MKNSLIYKYQMDIQKLFPIKVPDHMKNVKFDFDNCSVRLFYLLNDHHYYTFKSLVGRSVDDFLEMKGFGDECLKNLINLLKAPEMISLEKTTYSSNAISSASDEDKIQPKSIKDYIIEENLLFLQVINIIKHAFKERQQEIFDHRIFPVNRLLTLEELSEKLNLTRERVRQLEKGMINRIGHGMYYPGAFIRRRMVDIFKQNRKLVLSFDDVFNNNFFFGCSMGCDNFPRLINFFQKVFSETFLIEENDKRIEIKSKRYQLEIIKHAE